MILKRPCRVIVPSAHFGYIATGIDEEVKLRANREGFLKVQLRPRRLVNVSKVNMNVDIHGVKYPSPIVLAPNGANERSYPKGEIATAKGREGRQSSANRFDKTNTGVEEVAEVRGASICFHLVPALRI